MITPPLIPARFSGTLPFVTNTPATAPDCGYYVDLKKTPERDLAIRLNANGRSEFATIAEVRDAFGIREALYRLLEDRLANGCEMVASEEIGALTDAPILSDEIVRDEAGSIIEAGRAFWFPDYQVLDEIEELRNRGVLLFRGFSELTPKTEPDEPMIRTCTSPRSLVHFK